MRVSHTHTRWFLVLLSLSFLAGCKSHEERAQDYYQSGLQLLEQKQPAKAALEFRNALKIKDDFVPALYSLGLAEEQQGHYDTAIRNFVAVGERDPKHLGARIRLASLLLGAGQLDDALKFADEAY